jgi:alpha-tubulin suppressor-like RCC1 family protein
MDLDYGSDDEGLEIAAKEDLLLLVHVYAFGSTEDGRLGVLNTDSPPPSSMKTLYPHPIDMSWALSTDKTQSLSHEQYVCEMVACGNRHTIFLMKNCLREDPVKRRRKRKVYLVGLNQLGLCEEPGISQAQEIFWDDPSVMSADPPVFVTAGNGTSFIITTHGQVYSWGNGNQGRLGHGDGLSMTVPRHISSLRKFIVTKISTGLAHTIAITHDHMLFAWYIPFILYFLLTVAIYSHLLFLGGII